MSDVLKLSSIKRGDRIRAVNVESITPGVLCKVFVNESGKPFVNGFVGRVYLEDHTNEAGEIVGFAWMNG